MQKKFVLVCLILVFFIVACTQHKISAGINPVQESDLESTSSIAIYDLYVVGEDPALVVESSGDIGKVIHALDYHHAVTAKTFCSPRYRLQLLKQDGSSVEIDYFCDEIAPFIRSDLGYFENKDYAATEEFVDVIDALMAQNSIPVESVSEMADDPPFELANPASVYCVDQGDKLEIRKDESGGEFGVCIFEDGSECEEWAYFRGECVPGR